MIELEDIDGVGPSYAEELEENGYESVSDVAEADADAIDSLITTLDGADLVESATELVDADDDGGSASVSGDVIELDLDLDTDQRNHLISGLVNEEIRARRTNKKEDVESAKETIQKVIDGDYTFTRHQLDTAYRAANGVESEYRSTRGIGSFVTKLHNLKEELQEARIEHQESMTQ